MTILNSIFRPVGKKRPCQVCGSSNDCLSAAEGQMVAAICSRIESRQRCGKLGWLHLVVDRGPVWSKSRQRILKSASQLGKDSGE